MKNMSHKRRLLSDFSDIMDHPKKPKNEMDLPFDIDMYIKKEYNDEREKWIDKYQKDYLKNYMDDYEVELRQHQNYYREWINSFVDEMNNSLFDKDKPCIIKITMYGPNEDYSKIEKEMRDKALKNFCYVLSKKGYVCTEEKVVKHVNDSFVGGCNECIRTISIY